MEERNNPDIEPANSDLRTRPGVVLKNLRKVKLGKQSWWQSLWGGARGVSSLRVDADSDIEVVKGLNLTLYEGQCFAIVVSYLSNSSVCLYCDDLCIKCGVTSTYQQWYLSVSGSLQVH